MPEFLQKQWDALKKYWSDMPKGQHVRVYVMAGIVLAAIVSFLILTLRVDYVPLLEGADDVNLTPIVNYLTENNIPFQKGDNQIFVDAKRKKDIEFDLTTQGVISPDVTFSDTWTKLSLTATEADKTHLWNEFMKNDLVYKLKKFENVENATIDFTKPEKSYWATQPTDDQGMAYVMLKTVKPLTDLQVEGAALVVASSLGIQPSAVNIVDQNLNPLSRRDVNSDLARAGTQDEKRKERQIELEAKVYDHFKIGLANHADFDTMSVSANPVLDFDILKSSSKTYTDPNPDGGGFEQNSETLNETLTNGTAGSVPGTDTNPTVGPGYGTTGTEGSDYSKKHEVSDKLYNETDSIAEKALGNLVPEQSTLSISVWYGKRIETPDGLTETFLADVKKSAAAATGVPETNITVNVQRLAADVIVSPTLMETLTALLDQFGFYVFMLILLVAMALTVMPKRKKVDETALAAGAEAAFAGPKFVSPEDQEPLPDLNLDEQSEIKKQIDKFVQQKPDAVAQLLRNWLSEEWD